MVERKLFFGALSNDYLLFNRVMMSSALPNGTNILSAKANSATSGFNGLLEKAEGYDIAVLSHQDIYYPEGWVEKFNSQIDLIPDDWLVVSGFGIGLDGKHVGRIYDRRLKSPMKTPDELPKQVMNIDGCQFALNLKHGFRFEEMEGWDLYDVYLGLRAKQMGLKVWVIDAPVEHFATRSWNWKPDEVFLKNAAWLKQRFPNEKIISTCYNETLKG